MRDVIIFLGWIGMLYIAAALPDAHMRYMTIPQGLVFLTLLPGAFAQFCAFYVKLINLKQCTR